MCVTDLIKWSLEGGIERFVGFVVILLLLADGLSYIVSGIISVVTVLKRNGT